jgi:PEP-CTERM motif
MKKLVMIISLVMVLSLTAAPAVMAVTISPGDYVTLTAYNGLDNAGIMTYSVSHDGGKEVFSYDTFCIQDNVYIWPNTSYLVANVSHNVGYFSPHSPAGAGPLNQAVDYLFAQFASGAYYYQLYTDPNKLSNQADFQRLLWSLQGSGPAYTSVGTAWATDLDDYEHDASLQHSWGTEVLNIVSGDGDIQNQLYHPVPEPATMLLLGLGLVGVAVARKRFQK